MTDHALCLHAHFYQPPRGNPFLGDDLGVETGAEPYRNFNEKITAECYAPNAALQNFEYISFNLGSTLARWLEANAPEAYQQIIAADRVSLARWGVGNALAQPVHHTILPLARTRDRMVQVRWGLISFEHRYGRAAEGMWLPEMAVDLETLQVLHEAGVTFTLLSQSQVTGATAGGGPYWVRLPSGGRMAVFVRDEWLSNELSFGVHNQGGAGRWAHNVLGPLRRSDNRLLVLAMDGETFGHHHPGEEHFLHWLMAYEAPSVGFAVTSLARELRDHPPAQEIEIKEYTAWSCQHGLGRWSTGCECTPGDTRWKGALRRALDNLASKVDEAYTEFMRGLQADPLPLLENYLRLRLGAITEAQLLQQAGLHQLPAERAQALLKLLLAQFHRQRMYVSCTFFFEDLDRHEPRYAVANGVRANRLVQQATGADFSSSFRRDLAQAASNRSGLRGDQILDEVLGWSQEAESA